MKIFINPGHDQKLDPGACGNGLREADVVLKIGKRVEGYLRAVGYDVKLFQYDGLGEICFDANNWKADLFVSIHCNAATGSAKGTETFTSGGAKSTRLANCIQTQLVNSLPVVNRGVKTANYYVLKNTDAPAVLVETAFIDNLDDAKLLLDREDDFARAIALVANGCKVVGEGANMPSTLDAIEYFQANKILFCPAKAANAGGVAVSALEMSQNSERLSWTFEEVDERLKGIMANIYRNAKQNAVEFGDPDNLVMGANIAGFKKVAEAMTAQGLV